MTKLGSDTGKIDFPYLFDMDNRYADGHTHSDIQQCQVSLYRTGDSEFLADITYGDGSESSGNINLPVDLSDDIIAPPKGNKYLPLTIQRTAPIGEEGGDGSPINFFYGYETEREFDWKSNTQGADNTLNAGRPVGKIPSDIKGRYCLYTPVKTADGKKTQEILCYWPCIAPA